MACFPNMAVVDATAAGFALIASKSDVTLGRENKGTVESKTCPVASIGEGRAPILVLRRGIS